MNFHSMQWIARSSAVRRALLALNSVPGHVLLILPSTRRALVFARHLCITRDCYVMSGPVTSDAEWRFGALLRSPADIAKALAGQEHLPRTVLSFPDQTIGAGPSAVWIPFLGTRYSFSVIEALLAVRHRSRVFAFRTCALRSDFALLEVPYVDLLATAERAAPLVALIGRLLGPLENELKHPPTDWLAARWLAQRSEAHSRLQLREELKDLECLLRLHLLSPRCDRLRTGTAVAAVIARQSYLLDGACR